jgi:hypothetical protein
MPFNPRVEEYELGIICTHLVPFVRMARSSTERELRIASADILYIMLLAVASID